MGAFFLSPSEFQIPLTVRNVFTKQGFDQPVEFLFDNYKVLIYKKQLLDYFQTANLDESCVIAVGTFFYRKRKVKEGLSLFLNDFLNHSINLSEAVGSFIILVWHVKRLYFYSDRSGIQNIFFNEKHKVASSSFLATTVALSALSGKLKLNRDALVETLVTGNLIGPETLLEGITRYEPSIHENLMGIERISIFKETQQFDIPKNFNVAIDEQLKSLRYYFQLISENLNTNGSITGITGGFDSRLLYLLIREQTNNCKLYSTAREKVTFEQICAQKFASEVNKPLYSLKHTILSRKEPTEVESFISQNFYFNDGIIRTHQIWLEEIKSRQYLFRLYSEEKIGFSGVGGEQYRNSEYLLKNNYNFKNWVKYELIYKNSGNVFKNRRFHDQIAERISKKIRTILKINKDSRSIQKKEIKRYYNECWNTANRTVRNNVENQLVYFLSPFTDYYVSKIAYRAIPFIGQTHRFEKEMITKLAPELSHIITNYGYSPNQSVPIKYILGVILKGVIGLRNFNYIYYYNKKRHQNGIVKLLKDQNSLVKYFKLIQNLDLPISIDKLYKNDFLAPLIIETGILLHLMDEYISYD